MWVSEERLLLGVLWLRGQNAGIAISYRSKLRSHVVAQQGQPAGPTITDDALDSFLTAAERVQEAEG